MRTKTKKRRGGIKARLNEEYGLNIKYWRYTGRKGVYWYVLSRVIRQRDFKRWGVCVSCGAQFGHWGESQAGHYAPAGDCGFDLLFDLDNIHAECPSCNNPRFSPGKLIPYRATLVRRYGEAYVNQLDTRYADRHKTITKEWSQKEYDTRIRALLDTYSIDGII